MPVHSHDFVETYKGLVGFGLDRQTNENTIIYYLQKFSDDELMQVIKSRLQDQELAALFETLSDLLRKHLNEDEYHRLFLKEEHSHTGPA
jgi:TorA maturation chaperone TorD